MPKQHSNRGEQRGSKDSGARKHSRDLGRDGITRMVDRDRALRARGLGGAEEEKTSSATLREDEVLPYLIARIRGQ